MVEFAPDLSERNGLSALQPLRLHPIRRIEVFLGIGDELHVAWMIDRFHSDDDVDQFWIVV